MNYNRRNFLKSATLLSGAVATLPAVAREVRETGNDWLLNTQPGLPQRFNMSGYAAPKIDKVRIGLIGLGQRGPGAVNRMTRIEGGAIKAMRDKVPERSAKAQRPL